MTQGKTSIQKHRGHLFGTCLLLGCVFCPAAFAQAGQEPVSFVFSGWTQWLPPNALRRLLAEPNLDADGFQVAPRTTVLPQLRTRRKHPIRRIKNSLGMDYRLAEQGGLHFSVYQRRRPKDVGLRWQLNQDHAGHRVQRWSVGGKLDLIRTEEGERFVSFVPQLMVNPDGAHLRARRWRVRMEYGYWFGSQSRAAVAERVPQVNLKWRF